MTPFDRDFEMRAEQVGDGNPIAVVVEAAFGRAEVARLVDSIRASPGFIPELSVVATLDGSVVGHVMISAAELRDGAENHRIATLSPLAVADPFRRRGIGSALVREVAARADRLGEPLVVLEGSPGFYGGEQGAGGVEAGAEGGEKDGVVIEGQDRRPAPAIGGCLLRRLETGEQVAGRCPDEQGAGHHPGTVDARRPARRRPGRAQRHLGAQERAAAAFDPEAGEQGAGGLAVPAQHDLVPPDHIGP